MNGSASEEAEVWPHTCWHWCRPGRSGPPYPLSPGGATAVIQNSPVAHLLLNCKNQPGPTVRQALAHLSESGDALKPGFHLLPSLCLINPQPRPRDACHTGVACESGACHFSLGESGQVPQLLRFLPELLPSVSNREHSRKHWAGCPHMKTGRL